MPDSPTTAFSRLRHVLRIAAAAPRAGLAGGILLICCAMLLLLDGINLSTPGTSAGNATTSTTTTNSPATLPRDMDSPEDSANPENATASLAGQPVLTVLIDERSYRIQVPTEPEPLYRDSSLEQIRSLASTTTGDTNGIRVRILRRETARQSAENALHQTLEQAGITVDAILMPSETVP